MTQSDSHRVATPSGRARPVAVPWREIACRLAEGAKPAAIAADLGLQEERIWRHLRKSLRFRFYLRQAMERQRLLAGLQLATLGQAALVSRGLDPNSLDGDLLRLLNEAAPDRDIGQQIEQLGKIGGPPPNMAVRRRLAEEKRQMDMQVEVLRIQDAARAVIQAAAQAVAPAPAAVAPPAPKGNEPPRSDANASEPERTATNASEALRTPANTSEPARTAANLPEPQRALRLRWSPPPKPRQPPAQALPVGRDGAPDS